ncbi:porin [Undibacterium sp. JH2W]|uniref:porin n=1 Tax=Undibacterium sp. JH2W TaxID=3413037 RepID=UPI003BF36BB6
MKKNALFCSVLLVSPIVNHAAFAQGSITIYGIVDVGIIKENSSNTAGSALKLESGLQSQSRIGFKGSESLGSDLTANFVLESGLNADTGSYAQNLGFSSQSWVGLSGTFGNIRFGRQFTPYFAAVTTSEPFDTSGPGDATRLLASSGYRMNNSIKYSLPYANGWYGDIAYGAGELAGNNSANRQLSADFGYAHGPVDIKLGYHNVNDANGSNPIRHLLMGGTYDFGLVKLWLIYGTSKDSMALDTRDTLLGLTAPVGAGLFAVDYIRKTDRVNNNANATQMALGYYYPLSLRTNLYAIHSRLSNDQNASYSVVVPGSSNRITAIGMRHKF